MPSTKTSMARARVGGVGLDEGGAERLVSDRLERLVVEECR